MVYYVKGMGANKSAKDILKASQSTVAVHEIKWSFNKASNIHRVSQTHSAQSSVEDELMMHQDLRMLHPVRVVSSRYHAHFPDIEVLHGSHIGWQDNENYLR